MYLSPEPYIQPGEQSEALARANPLRSGECMVYGRLACNGESRKSILGAVSQRRCSMLDLTTLTQCHFR